MKKKDYTMRYFVANFTCFVLLYFLSSVIIFNIVHMHMVRIILEIILFYLCAQIELRYLTFYVNYMVILLLLPQGIRQKELELLKKSRINDKKLEGGK